MSDPLYREKFIEMWNDPAFRERETLKRQITGADPVFRKKMTIINRERGGDPKFRDKISKAQKELWLNEDYKQKMSEIQKVSQNKPDVLERNRQSQIEAGKNPELRKFRSDFNKEYQNRPDVIELNREIQRAIRGTIENREKSRQLALNNWKSEEYAQKVMTNSFKYKDYIMPSGKTVKVQGYESRALDILLRKYTESDVLVSFEIPSVSYEFNGNLHTYRPDIYIISENKIIEVKSKYTYELHKELNIAKKRGCIAQGFNFEFMIL
jgi:hypothetical protein